MNRSRPILALLLSLPLAVEAATADRRTPQPVRSREPIESLHATVLSGRSGKATVSSSGRGMRVRLRRDERLTEIAEAGRGWVAAGLRERSQGIDLVVVRQTATNGSGPDRLPSPARGGGLYRAAPRLLVEGGELAGVAWLEGARPDRMSVRAAQWTGASWTAQAVVAKPGPGSQTGLAQAILADGSWLLVWSRFDGRENELYWSRWSGGDWTPPLALERGDGVPDVTPTLLPTPEGALLAWSEYDGRDYRLRAARFTGAGWIRLALDAGRGALQPRFRRQAAGTWLLVRSAAPTGWTALEIRPDGSGGRLARVETANPERPLLRPSAGGLAFQWSGGLRLVGAWERPR